MKVVLLNEKGGVGKTTLALLLASSMQTAGMDVAFADLCPDKAATDWCIRCGNVPLVHEAGNKDYIIYDTPGGLSYLSPKILKGIKNALSECDHILIPSNGSVLERESLARTLAFANQYKAEAAQVKLVANQIANGHDPVASLNGAVGHRIHFCNTSIPTSHVYRKFAEQGIKAVTGENRTRFFNLLFELDA